MRRRGGSIRLLEVFGIRVGVDPSWFIVLFLLIVVLSGQFRQTLNVADSVAYVTAVAGALLFFASIVAHELAHALVARRAGIDTKAIDLWFFGGLARLSREPRTPGEEFRIAVAGPLLTLAVVALCVGLGVAVVGGHRYLHATAFEGTTAPALGLLSWLALVNAVLLVFNLVPAYPLDGGRIARAAVWRFTGDRARGTRAAAGLGRLWGYALACLGGYLLVRGDLTGLWLVALGLLFAGAARGALIQSAFTQRLEGVRVADIMDAEPVSVGAEWPLDRAWDEGFARYRWTWFPVVDGPGHVVGLLREDSARAGGDASVASVMEASEPWQVTVDQPLEALLGSEPLQRLGALVAVDEEGRLRGVVTLDHVRRAVSGAFGSTH